MMTVLVVIGIVLGMGLLFYLADRYLTGSSSRIIEGGHPAQRIEDIESDSGNDGNDGNDGG